MKKLFIILLIIFTAGIASAQSNKPASYKAPVLTAAFTDSLKKEIATIMPADYNIKLLYKSPISAEGKLTDPKIWRETANGTIEDNDFVVKLRLLIKSAPAWKPAFDSTTNKNLDDDEVEFRIDIKKGEISIEQAKSDSN